MPKIVDSVNVPQLDDGGMNGLGFWSQRGNPFLVHDFSTEQFDASGGVRGVTQHEGRELFRRGVLALQGGHHTPLVEDGDAVRERHHLLHLVRNEEDRMPLLREVAHDAVKRLGFLWSENGGWFIKNQQPSTSVQHLDNFDALLFADGQFVNLAFRINVEVVTVAEFLNLLMDFSEVQHRRTRQAEDDVLCHRVIADQHEMLKDHADALTDRLAGCAELHHLPPDANFALVRSVKSGNDAHEGGLARAILAEDRVNLTLAQVEVDVIVGKHSGKALGDLSEFKDGLDGSGGHGA